MLGIPTMIHMAGSRSTWRFFKLPCWNSFSRRLDRKAGNQVSVNAAIFTANTPIGRPGRSVFNIIYDCVGMRSDSLSFLLFSFRADLSVVVATTFFLLEFEGLLSRGEYLCISRVKRNSFAL